MEDSTFFHQYPMDSITWPLDDLDFPSFTASPKSYSSNKRFNSTTTQQNSFPIERPTKQQKTTMSTTWNAYGTSSDFMVPKASSSSSSQLISFEHSNASSVASQQLYNPEVNVVKPKIESVCNENLDFAAVVSQGDYLNYDKTNSATTTTRNPTQAQDHVIAERKRREKLSQRFIALSAIVPGLKKVLCCHKSHASCIILIWLWFMNVSDTLYIHLPLQFGTYDVRSAQNLVELPK